MDAERPDRTVLVVGYWKAAIGYAIFALIVAVVVGVAIFQGATLRWLLIFLPILALYLFVVFNLRREWEAWTFRLTEETLEMNHGWFFRRSRTVARDRIQHLDVTSGPLDRGFGIVHVVVHTAGTTVGTIPGLSPARAELLREQLFGATA
jgi:membrane protein YdbS with pleckstrin-like domain